MGVGTLLVAFGRKWVRSEEACCFGGSLAAAFLSGASNAWS